ncbi:uncharacterized protein LOC143133537 [Alosa pseudoharengus]|uniref:uncharacterized protein LOC143133537 n=1 Tax=Alosa pseudoharengus TaxID=34774 RepID=UPI003F892333
MMVLGAFLLLSLLIGESVGNTITPSRSSVVVIEEETVTFSCNYSSSDVNNLQWYRQYPNSIPEFLYYKEEKRVFLELSSAEASDSAVYYCALVPTVTGTQTLLSLTHYQSEEELNRQHLVTSDLSEVLSCGGVWFNPFMQLLLLKSTVLTVVQHPNSAPQHLLSIYGVGENQTSDVDPRLSGLRTKDKLYLHISSAELSDSALYYCALQPTVTDKHTSSYKNLPV